MLIETTGWGGVLLIVIMALVTLTTRWGGVFIMSFVPLSVRVKRFISAMSGSVLVAVLTPLAIYGDRAAQAAFVVTALWMGIQKKPLPAILAGIATTAIWRQWQV